MLGDYYGATFEAYFMFVETATCKSHFRKPSSNLYSVFGRASTEIASQIAGSGETISRKSSSARSLVALHVVVRR
jgi:hypothetical protein